MICTGAPGGSDLYGRLAVICMLASPGMTAHRRRNRLSQQRRNEGAASPGPSPSIPEKWLRDRRVDEINPLVPVQTRPIRGFLIPSRPPSRSSSKIRLDKSWSEADMFPDLRHRLAPLPPSPSKPATKKP